MNAVSCLEIKQNFDTYTSKVYQDCDTLMVLCKNNENVVIISADEYNSLLETIYLLSGRENAKHLEKSIAQHKKLNSTTY